jgi:hypothetical protein
VDTDHKIVWDASARHLTYKGLERLECSRTTLTHFATFAETLVPIRDAFGHRLDTLDPPHVALRRGVGQASHGGGWGGVVSSYAGRWSLVSGLDLAVGRIKVCVMLGCRLLNGNVVEAMEKAMSTMLMLYSNAAAVILWSPLA